MNNITGRCYLPETLKELLKFCQRHQLHYISDEVYGLSVFDSGDPDAVPFTSVLSLDPSGLIDPKLVHVLYGFSKVSIIPLKLPISMFNRTEELTKKLNTGLRIWRSPPRLPHLAE